jgi:hypothetical protein
LQLLSGLNDTQHNNTQRKHTQRNNTQHFTFLE